jgi:hypothetical protein
MRRAWLIESLLHRPPLCQFGCYPSVLADELGAAVTGLTRVASKTWAQGFGTSQGEIRQDHAGRRARRDPPGIEARRHEEVLGARAGATDERHAVRRCIVVIGPVVVNALHHKLGPHEVLEIVERLDLLVGMAGLGRLRLRRSDGSRRCSGRCGQSG